MNDYCYSASGHEIEQWRSHAQHQAIAADIDPSEVDWLLRGMAQIDPLALRLQSYRDWPTVALRRSLADLYTLWQQRIEQRVPVQYLVGQTPWRQFELIVSPAVLIPRPETELIIDIVRQVVRLHPALGTGTWVDLGTGSGAIALGLADALPDANIHAVDVSDAALAIAQRNAEQTGLRDRIQFYQGSWFAPLAELKGSLSGVISNPPYIPTDVVRTLEPEVVNHEPTLALDGGADGLDAIRHLVDTAPAYLCPGGFWLTELMQGQSEAIAHLLTAQGSYQQIEIHRDLAGIDRFVSAYKAVG